MNFQFSIFNLQMKKARPAGALILQSSGFSIANPSRRAFTLTELLVAISIIVLLLTLALPAFSFLTGSNSVGAATNVVGATLSRSRMDAVGLQKLRGVAYFVDASTERVTAAFVEEKTITNFIPANSYVVGDYVLSGGQYYVCINPASAEPVTNTDYWRRQDLTDMTDSISFGCAIMDVVADSDRVPLPTGVGVRGAGGFRSQPPPYSSTNPYLAEYPFPGVILFDGNGRVAGRRQYALPMLGIVGYAITANRPIRNFPQIGAVFFSSESLKNAVNLPDDLPNDNDRPKLQAEDKWISENARPMLINRYNGTLIKGE